jgi:endonuclease/exonuclease/phosphatase family metal-dependent hydrolase
MMDVRLTDRDVILAREDFLVTKTERNTFETQLMVSGVDVVRGWVAIETPGFRFMSTHLESAQDQIRDAQAAQILVDTADTTSLILTGDFNFAPGSTPYETFDAAKLDDVANAGPTCCQDADLRNADSKLTDRIDLVWQRGGFSGNGATLLGPEKTASGLWASDHAGVKVTLTR